MTISLIAALIPLLFMGDVVGRLFREFSITVCVALLVSAVVSLTATPALCRVLLHLTKAFSPGALRVRQKLFSASGGVYDRTLIRVLRHQSITLAVALIVLLITLMLFWVIPKGFFPAAGHRPERLVPVGPETPLRVVCVLLALPLLIPIFIVVGFAVRFKSKGPVLFLQKRTGLPHRNFTILKFRTMEHLENGSRNKVTTAGNQRFTSVGPFLRRWKLDELPQVLNVLIGDMTLVGPRPKLPEHQLGDLKCRPGITGAATIAFAREEQILARLPHHDVDDYYHSIILPTNSRLDREYKAQCTFLSDLKHVLDTILRKWDASAMYRSLEIEPIEMQHKRPKLKTQIPAAMAGDESLVSGD